MTHFDTIIIGAGAAGLMCGAKAASLGKKVLIIEHNKEVGKKILISGGGRCNFTNKDTKHHDFESQNPHFHKSALSRYTPAHFIELLLKHKLTFKEKKLGQLFCDQKSPAILKMLVEECMTNKVTIMTSTTVSNIQKINQHFELKTNKGDLTSDNLVIATGGLSFPGLGATDFGYNIAKQFGIALTKLSPSLVPLTIPGFKELAGVALPVEVKLGKYTITDDLLFTHKGLSGPAILKISLYYHHSNNLTLNLLPGQEILSLIEHRKRQPDKKIRNLSHLITPLLPASVAKKWLRDYLPADNNDLNQLSKKDLARIHQMLHEFPITPTGDEGYKKAEVTRGGIDTNELSSKTFETKKVPGLYFIGEVVDTTGLLGGYNFQWCWACGHACGESLA